MLAKRIVLKLGSGVVAGVNGGTNMALMESVARQVTALMKVGMEICIVSSGAVASDPNVERMRGFRSMCGQVSMMTDWAACFAKHGIEVAQLLVTDHNFQTGVVKRRLTDSFKHKVVTIINYNDGTSDEEVDKLPGCSDNDQTARMVCEIDGLGIEALVVAIDKDGFLNENEEVILIINEDNYDYAMTCVKGGNAVGTGGMGSKAGVCHELVKKDIVSVMSPASSPTFLVNALDRINHGLNKVGTIFI